MIVNRLRQTMCTKIGVYIGPSQVGGEYSPHSPPELEKVPPTLPPTVGGSLGKSGFRIIHSKFANILAENA